MSANAIHDRHQAATLDGTELVPIVQGGKNRSVEAAALGIPVMSISAPLPLGDFQTWIDISREPPMLNVYIGDGWVPLYAIGGDGSITLASTLNVLDPTTDGEPLTLGYFLSHGGGVLRVIQSIDCSASPDYPAANNGDVYHVTVAGKIGGASGIAVAVGAVLLCTLDGSASGTQASVGANWVVIPCTQRPVSGPASATGGDFAQFDGTSGQLVKDGGLSLDTDGTLAAASDSRIASQKAVKTYADTKASLAGAAFTGATGFANGSASAPSAFWNTNSGFFWDATNSALGLSVAGTEVAYWTTGFTRSMLTGGASNQHSIQGEATTNIQLETYNATYNTACAFSRRRGHGTIASPSVPVSGDTIGNDNWQPYTGSGFTNAGRIAGVLTETATVDATHVGFQFRFYACPIGSGTLTEILRLDNESGLSMFGANIVIDQNRALRPRATTISGAVTPAAAGAVYFHSDAQGGAGELAIDTGSAYRHAGQAALKHLTSANATYTPRADGRIVRDSVALSADQSLTLSTTNATDGYAIKISRRGSSGGHNRNVYQSDGVTLIVALADNASADIVYDATAGMWFQA